MSQAFQKDGPEETVFSGRLIEIINQTMNKDDKKVVFEWGQRAPGVRLIAIDTKERILLTREYRHEQDSYDYRLPGGKVADTLSEWHQQVDDNRVNQAAQDKVIQEAKEEAGLIVRSVEKIEVVPDGATFKWDLHYFLTRDFEVGEQDLEHGEDITVDWYATEDVLRMIKEKQIKEGRSVYVLMPYLLD